MKVGKIVKRTLIFLVVFVVLIVGAAIAIPVLFKNQILERVKTEVNKQVDAEVDFNNDIELSLIWTFPNVRLGIKDVSVVGKNEFEGIPLARIGKAALELDLLEVIRNDGPLSISSVSLDEADIRVNVTPDGKANYDIAISPTENIEKNADASPSEFALSLQSYGLTRTNIIYDDKATATYVKVENLNHKGSGNFTETVYDLDTNTEIDKLTVSSAEVSYIYKAKTEADITINIDNNTGKYTLKDNDIRLNALRLGLDGWIVMEGENMDLDLAFNAPSTNFKDLLSMVPSAYTEDFKDVKTTGTMRLDGNVKGKLTPNSLPAFALDLGVDQASFQYPDLPLGVDNIAAKVKINSPSNDLDKMTVDVPSFHMELGNNPFDATFKLRNPISDPNIQTKINGVLNLDELSKAFPMEGVDQLNGLITANMDVDTRMSYIENEEYEKVNMSGDLKVEKVNYQQKGMPPVNIWGMDMSFSPQQVDLRSFEAALGKSDIKANGKLDNILAWFSPDLTMKGNLVVRSKKFDANEWITETSPDSAPQTTSNNTSTSTTSDDELFDRFDFKMDARMDQILYEDYDLRDAVLVGRVTPNRASVEQFSAKMGGTDIYVTGEMNNVFGYLFDNQTLEGDVLIRSNNLDMNDLYASSSSETTSSSTRSAEASEAFPVPANMDVQLRTDIRKLTYDDMIFSDMKGTVSVRDERAAINSFEARGFGGLFAFDGYYDTKEKDKPAFDLGYNLKDLDVQKTISDLNSVQQLAPVMEFISGFLSSNMRLSGNLNPDMSLDYSTLTGNGELATFDALVKNYPPLEKLSNFLDLPDLKAVKIKDTKNLFDLKDGMIELQPNDIELNDLVVNIGGTHGIVNQSMDYTLKFAVPKEKLGNNVAGQFVGKGMDFFGEQAGKLGIDIADGDVIKFNVRLTGNMSNPEMKVNLLGTDKESIKEELLDQAKEVVMDQVEDKVIDAIADKVDIGLDSTDNSLEDVKDQALDKAEEVVNEKVDEATEAVKEAVTEQAKENINSAIGDTLGAKAEEIIGKDAKDKVDELKDKIKFPFGKNKNKKDGDN